MLLLYHAHTEPRRAAIVERYLESVEEVINIPELINRFERVLAQGKGGAVIAEMVLQSRIEFNLESEP
ncbi:hypothetical protein myaer102_30990 [Microcystis viridis NIES-102]|uniref:Uncharacterized protein n=1 Tax=Microcystis viridis NIES-102 TaxID=213615 RepID=A0A3G9K1F3_MICVR|nr:hypothetical protein [Microcystis viridis]BBH40534.1 hypothetical protein myaer102_30990 [Microcystis viridis NIES-102]